MRESGLHIQYAEIAGPGLEADVVSLSAELRSRPVVMQKKEEVAFVFVQPKRKTVVMN